MDREAKRKVVVKDYANWLKEQLKGSTLYGKTINLEDPDEALVAAFEYGATKAVDVVNALIDKVVGGDE